MHDQESIGEKALKAGFSAILVKPLKQSRLFDCIALVLNKERHPSTKSRLSTVMPMPMLGRSWNSAGLILVAEDNAVNQKVALLLLRELGFSAHVVGNGREAIEAANRTQYSIILMDCQMPEMDGMEATSEIRRIETLTGRHVPIIAMTAHAMQGDREKCIGAGMDDYISKPVTASKLSEVLARWLPRDADHPRASKTQAHVDQEGFAAPFYGHANGEKDSEDELKPPPPINWDGLKNSCGQEGALEILRIFVESSRDIVHRLENALQANDLRVMKLAAHELKGASASVGSQQMASVCKQLEEAVKEQDQENINKGMLQLKTNFEKVVLFSQSVLVGTKS
jgi:CheY-like chemotaxis protein/HPt (histidine-containing phosphotransfer) domain-containing protein